MNTNAGTGYCFPLTHAELTFCDLFFRRISFARCFLSLIANDCFIASDDEQQLAAVDDRSAANSPLQSESHTVQPALTLEIQIKPAETRQYQVLQISETRSHLLMKGLFVGESLRNTAMELVDSHAPA